MSLFTMADKERKNGYNNEGFDNHGANKVHITCT